MSEWVAVTVLKDLQRRKKTRVEVAGEPVALFWAGEKVFALHDVCIHEERSLSKGAVLKGRVVCPGHQWQFDLATGWVEEQERCQPTFDVKVEGDTVYVSPVARIQVASGGSAAVRPS